MFLSHEQLCTYRDDGFLVLDELFSADEVDVLRDALARDCRAPGEHLVVEDGSDEVRAVYASHRREPEFAGLVRSSRLLGPARQLLGAEAYVYQFKVNTKHAFTGERWAWHQDYVAWMLADNLPAPRLVNVGLFLDDVTEFNGPVIFVPGSHRADVGGARRRGDGLSAEHIDPDDIALAPAQLAALVDRRGLVSPKGRAGTAVLFHPQVVHGSASNMSPFHRRLLIVTYNDVANLPRPPGEPRPDYLVGRDTRPLTPIDHPLTALARTVTA